jgi:hypothetical protein
VFALLHFQDGIENIHCSEFNVRFLVEILVFADLFVDTTLALCIIQDRAEFLQGWHPCTLPSPLFPNNQPMGGTHVEPVTTHGQIKFSHIDFPGKPLFHV